jgi:hypothetical protein
MQLVKCVLIDMAFMDCSFGTHRQQRELLVVTDKIKALNDGTKKIHIPMPFSR